jgi:hypothetical protein
MYIRRGIILSSTAQRRASCSSIPLQSGNAFADRAMANDWRHPIGRLG